MAIASRPVAPIAGAPPAMRPTKSSCTAVLRSDPTELLPGDERAARVAGSTRALAELLMSDGPDLDWKRPDPQRQPQA